MPRTLLAARLLAGVVGLVMVIFLLTREPIVRFDNPFFVPDVTLTLMVLVSAVVPRRAAAPAMVFALAFTSGVIMVSLFTYIVRGEFAWGNFALVAVSAVTAIALGGAIARADRRPPA